MQTSLALAVLLLALVGFAALTVRRGRGGPDHDGARAQLRGFVYVGAGAGVALTVSVLVLQALGPVPDRAATLAVLGFFGLCLYLGVAFTLFWWTRRPTPVLAGPRRRLEED